MKYRFWHGRVLILIACVSLVASAAIHPVATAQDGTSAATPPPVTHCLVPKPNVRMEDAGVSLVPSAATPVATPVATSGPVSTLEQDITDITRALFNCLNEGRHSMVVELTGDLFRGSLLGVLEPVDGETYVALSSALSGISWRVVSIEEIVGTGRGTARAYVTYTIGHEVRTGEWSFAIDFEDATPHWVITSETAEPTRKPTGTSVIQVLMENNTFTLNTSTVDTQAVSLDGTNRDDEAHEMLVLQLTGNARVEDLLTTPGPELPGGITYVGQLTVAPDGTGSLVLTDLEPGNYVIVCLLQGENGAPHLASGMQTTFTVR